MGNEKKKIEMKCSETKEKEGGVEGPKRKTDGSKARYTAEQLRAIGQKQ